MPHARRLDCVLPDGFLGDDWTASLPSCYLATGLKAVIPGAEMLEVVRGSLIFIVPLAAGIALLMLVPDLALVLPRLMR